MSRCPLEGLRDLRELATALDLPLVELRRLACSSSNYTIFGTQTGGKNRVVTAPRSRLARAQFAILQRLNGVALPDYLHSGVCGRSHLTHALTHVNGAWLSKLDLQGFYCQITASRVRRYFVETLGCSSSVASLLARLCTVDDHVPVGARSSQLLAFLVANPMFDALDRLATAEGVRFTLYVDDLCFSGTRATPAFLWRVKQVVHAHGYRYHHTKCHPPGQPRLVTGVLLTGGRAAVDPRLAARIESELHELRSTSVTAAWLRSLQGRLAAAVSIDRRYLPSLGLVQARWREVRAAGAPT